MRNRVAPHIDFGELTGLMGKILPSNLDMVLERRGRFLIGEWKREGEKIGLGQQILLNQFAKLNNFTVLVIIGDTESGMRINKVWQVHSSGFTVVARSKKEFKEFLNTWYNIV